MSETIVIDALDAETLDRAAGFLLTNLGREVSVRFSDVPCCPQFVVPLFALVDHYRTKGMKIALSFPQGSAIEQTFTRNDPKFPMGRVHRFSSLEEYLEIFKRVQVEILKLPNPGQGFRVAFEWCISEVMDNVIQHSGVSTGYFMIRYIPEKRLLKTSVFDLGRGIFDSFKGSKFSPSDAEEALRLAVRPNVTSGNGQGNGLYGLREIVKQSRDGRLFISSGGAEYTLARRGASGEPVESTKKSRCLPGFPGATLVDFQVVLDDALSIDRVFDDALPSTDVWLEDHELDAHTVSVRILEIVPGTVSREFGREMRQVVENLVDNEHKRVLIDFSGVDMCSSAFVDELVGKLLVKYQFVDFSRMIGFRSLKGLPVLLINHSIKQRLAET